MMEEKEIAYEGNQPYIFVSYCHKDKKAMHIIRRVQQRGYRVWFDKGIRGAENGAKKLLLR